jgi:dihydroneopterin aldolase
MSGSDQIQLRDLRVDAICGVLPHERTTPQPLSIDVDVDADLGKAGATDDLADTIDYGALVAAAEHVATTLQPQLLEHLADRIAHAVLEVDDRVDAATVTVRKLEPPVPQRLDTSGVRVTRRR